MRSFNPQIRALDPFAPLSVGNGEFAFTADVTGLQTFPEAYQKGIPLCTMSQWGWHTIPNPKGLGPADYKPQEFDTYGRKVPYDIGSGGNPELYNWLRENPHRLHLGRIGFELRKQDGSAALPTDLTGIHQELDLWSGTLRSRFVLEGVPAEVETCCHPETDLLAVRVRSPLAQSGRLRIRIEFPYGSPGTGAADWTKPEQHSTTVTIKEGGAELRRTLDADSYSVSLAWEGKTVFRQEGRHSFTLSAPEGGLLSFVCRFSPHVRTDALPGVDAVFAASANYWARFWSEGGAVDLSGSTDRRAEELQRRIVLSQYLTAIQCCGSMPPAETGLTCNSWYGKFHLEMHWWHAAHFALWGRIGLLERSLPYYESILSSAREKAGRQGYRGARWPKMTARDGRDSPSGIGPLLIWQQPHPIYYAYLCYRARPNGDTLQRYRDIVFETADFMASFAFFDSKRNRYVLGPPVIPAQENHPPRETWNPTFELEYWHWGLNMAQQWRRRLGLAPDPEWQKVIDALSPLPVQDGVYLAHENCPQTYTERNHDHPSMLAAYGVLPGRLVDRETMRRTLHKVLEVWDWPSTWGWDYPVVAMTAARLGEPESAVGALLMETPKNRYLPNGHNYQRPNLPLYLPGNGGLLFAVAMMAAGWEGAPQQDAPGFPRNGWRVRWEGLNRWA